ncbi:hypothetical protein KSGM81_01603 [Klebsiella quasipneumoniae]|uniref:Capsule repeat unit polymerase n=1 Tax=Klebsiella pneumoniae TaxID=573 RepID=A0A1C3SYQ7_KLEPN|nr:MULTISPECIES: EpsG family protein [Klebsiella]SCA95764.1 capsule repeat unit polymerase [Klebsiella pneumoniae]HBQ6650851.1 EpsG family protein [Klebsiella quasipneumoniae subsp. quasipneumoniae]EIY5064922.1 EpsG family protein [Klebsiella quasipneumoniae]MCJ1857141.1 EpsG family protein [Klebsiella quasipneumoniae subsp. similipneumoniae]MDZ3012589.1 EpsG family protein [Klebsiella quasipneumoniae]
MLPYIIALLLVYSWVVAEYKILNRKAVLFPLLILVVLATMRHYEIGTDANVYTRYFRFPFNNYSFQFDPEVETGYQYLVYLVREIYSSDYSLYFFAMALVSIFPVIYTLKSRSVDYPLSIYIYITFGLYMAMYNQIRQCIAMGICFLATKYLVNKNFIKYFVVILIASQFHVTAYLMLIFYFVCHNKLRIEYKIIPIVLSSAIAAPLMIAHMALNNSRYEHYTEEATKGKNGLLTVMLYVVIALFFYIIGKRLRKENLEYRIYECMYLCGVALLLPVAMLGTDPAGPQRIIQYFLYYVMLMFPIVFKKINNKFIYVTFIIVSFIYFVLMIASNIAGVYPYQFNPVFDFF